MFCSTLLHSLCLVLTTHKAFSSSIIHCHFISYHHTLLSAASPLVFLRCIFYIIVSFLKTTIIIIFYPFIPVCFSPLLHSAQPVYFFISHHHHITSLSFLYLLYDRQSQFKSLFPPYIFSPIFIISQPINTNCCCCDKEILFLVVSFMTESKLYIK